MNLAPLAIAKRTLLILCAMTSVQGIALESSDDSSSAPAHYCEVAMDLTVDGHPIASPSTIVEIGKEAEMTFEGRGGANSGLLRFVIDEPTVVRRATVIPTEMQLFQLTGDDPVLRATPHIALQPGQRADLQMMLDGMEGHRATLGVTAQMRSEAEVKARVDALKEQSD